MKELGILVMAHKGYLRYLKRTLESYRKIVPTPSYILLCYDNTFVTEHIDTPMDVLFPAIDTLALTDSLITSDKAFRANVGISWMWMQTYGAQFLASYDIEYILSINGDCILEIPQSFINLLQILKYSTNDVYSYEFINQNGVGTLCYLAKAQSLAKINKFLLPHYYNYTQQSYLSPEAVFGHAIYQQGFSCVENVENPMDSQHSRNMQGTFFNTIGLRHIHGGEKWRRSVHHKPLPERFYDTRYLDPQELKALRSFWDTGKTDKLVELGYWEKEPRNNEAELYPEPY
jgi:hypothetical protein